MSNTEELKKIASSLGLAFATKLKEPNPPKELMRGDFNQISGSWAKEHLIIPIGVDENYVVVAINNPYQHDAIKQLELCYGRPIKLIVTSEEEVTKTINIIRKNLMSDRTSELSNTKEETTEVNFGTEMKIDVTDADDSDAPIISFVNAIIFNANNERASDVHIESFEESVNVRFRVDGKLKDVSTTDKKFQAAITSRIKVMAGLNIAEKRLPQDGRIPLQIAGKDVDIRVSTIPTQHGERVVMRLLDKGMNSLDLAKIGLSENNYNKITKLVQKPNGIILVTGPTGSGKTTTLYAALSSINTPDKNILTVEDPVEYEVEGIGQMQIREKIGFTFASGLRAILRQDPDVVMVGEIRDKETAEIAIQASLTGHLVVSTLHTNDAPGATSRLLDMGIEPFLISSSLIAVVAQRLVRKLCPKCKLPSKITDDELNELGLDPTEIKDKSIFKPNPDGCPNCAHNGYKGRMGIHEFLEISDQIRKLINQSVASNVVRDQALKEGFSTLRVDGAFKVLAGDTSLEEVLRVTHEEEGE